MADLGVNPKLPTWDGNWKTFTDYRLACQLELDGLKKDDQETLAPRLARNLTGKAWEACLDIDRAKLKETTGLDYLLDFLKQKRGKQQVDILGEAFEKYFQSGDVVRQDKECLNDYEQRLRGHFRDIQRALQELGTTEKVPTEIYGWFLLNKHIRLEPSDVATLKSQTASYKVDDVMKALRKMWGGDSLTLKDQERKRHGNANRAYVVEEADNGEYPESSVWWTEDDEHGDDEPDEETEVWFEDALEALSEDPTDEAVLANFQEAKKAFYKDARRALDQSRVNRGFYPNNKGKGKGGRKGKGDNKPGEFHGQCMRCGKWGHKAQFCPQGPRKGKGKGTVVGFVFTNWTVPPEPEEKPNTLEQVFVNNTEGPTKAIMDCGASESIVGAWTLQGLSDELDRLGFAPSEEIQFDTRLRKSFVFGNNESSQALGQAQVNVGIHGVEQPLDVHVVEGQTPLLLSSKWLYEQEAIIDFKTGQAILPKITSQVVQLERAPTYHLLLPVTAYQGHDEAKHLTQVPPDDGGLLLRACAQMRLASQSAPTEVQE